MRRWVRYDFESDAVLEVDKVRLKHYAEAFADACRVHWNYPGVQDELYPWYRGYIEDAVAGRIEAPVRERLPVSGWERTRGYPIDFERALTGFRSVLQGCPNIYNSLDLDVIANLKNSPYYKEENGHAYILEELMMTNDSQSHEPS